MSSDLSIQDTLTQTLVDANVITGFLDLLETVEVQAMEGPVVISY